jgi:hypothetical protein
MKKQLGILTICTLMTFMSFSQCATSEVKECKAKETHRFGGWYCPDNLNGFPAVDIMSWGDVPVVNDRLPTREEASNGTSLMFIDIEEYPDAVPLDMTMPRLATFYCRQSDKEEIVIIIQAVNVLNDSVVGFRYLNGGNGSAHIHEVKFLSDDVIDALPSSRFVTLSYEIEATQAEIFDVMTELEFSGPLQEVFDSEKTLGKSWTESSVVNFKYMDDEYITSSFGGDIWGNLYVQMHFKIDEYQYAEKFLLMNNDGPDLTELRIVCGPYRDDFEAQKSILRKWGEKVKELSE